MDPYEYLFSRLKITIKKTMTDTFDYNFEYYIIFFRNEQVGTFNDYTMTNKKLLFDYLTAAEHSIDFWAKTKLQNLVKILKLFSGKLESKEHVDLLLTLNGLNKEV